jgi:hypothetical protein
MTELDVAMKKHMACLVHNEHRPFSYLDFIHFEMEGKEYAMTHGTFRNKISELREKGKVELAYNSGIAFYSLRGVRFGKSGTSSMTPTHIGVLLSHVQHRVPNIKKHPLYKYIKHHAFDQGAVHDIHLRFIVMGLWSILSDNSSSTGSSNSDSCSNSKSFTLQIDPFSRDIRLEKRVINDLEIQVTVHHTDTVTVVIGCSYAPIIVDEYGVIRLSNALSKIEEELSELIEQCRGSHSDVDLDTGAARCNPNIDVPNHMGWTVTRWDFGVDALVTYTGEKFFFSWGSSQNVLIVFYTKKWSQNDYRIRVEFQEFPNKPLGKALWERLIPRKGS